MAVTIVSYKNFFPEIALSLPANSRAACKEAADKVVEIAQELVPVRTGKLRASIKTRRVRNGWSASAGDPSGGVTYAPYVEFGTRFMNAEPFFFPALEQVQPEFPGMVAAHLRAFGIGQHFGVSIRPF